MNQISAYDEVAFPSYPYPQSHPDRLATIARLRGVETAPVDACRVLELGCGAGGNLLPMAAALPGSQFVGIDLSEQQIGIAREHVAATGATNVRLEARDLLTLDASFGVFDYIIAHGVYSWTTNAVRERILPICRDLLSPRGVAYVNYNTYPGWHLQGLLRDMLFQQVTVEFDPADRVRQARKMLDFLRQALPPNTTPIGALLRADVDAVSHYDDAFLFHAYLNVVNRPFYLHEFQQRTTDSGLQYLGDAETDATWPELAVPQLVGPLRELNSNQWSWEQNFDCARLATSRRSLVCHADVPIDRGPVLSALDGLHVAAALQELANTQPGVVTFQGADGRTISVSDSAMQASFKLLASTWPKSIPFTDLARESAVPGADAERWCRDVLNCFMVRVVELTTLPSGCGTASDDSPRATSFARRQATTSEFVANLRHQTVRPTNEDRRLLCQLDGRHSVDELSRTDGGNLRGALARLARYSLLARETGLS